jgi:hypothetical protein
VGTLAACIDGTIYACMHGNKFVKIDIDLSPFEFKLRNGKLYSLVDCFDEGIKDMPCDVKKYKHNHIVTFTPPLFRLDIFKATKDGIEWSH